MGRDLANSILDGLNTSQREAVLATEGPVLVAAGPGTGKTRTLIHRLAYLITVQHMDPESLLAVTFTSRAAGEMGQRLAALGGQGAARVCLGTFHSLCFQLLSEHGKHVGLPRDFAICSADEQSGILQEILGKSGRAAAPRLLKALSRARSQAPDPATTLAGTDLLDIYLAYQQRLRQRKLLDFDDLLALTVQLLETVPEVRQSVQRRYRYLSVDEYQDVNPVQYQLLRLLAGANANVWAVGDADQAIYAFRGAEVENFLRFEHDFPASRVIHLQQGYRCSANIVAAASQVVARNSTRLPYQLETARPGGGLIQVISTPDEEAEAQWIVRRIEEQVGGTSHYRHYQGSVRDAVSQRQSSFRDFAALFRLNTLSRPLQEALSRAGIPYRVVGAGGFFDRKVVKDVLAYLRLLRRPDDDSSLERILNIPPRGIGARTQAQLKAKAEATGRSFYQQLLADNTLPPSPRRAVEEFVQLIQQLQTDLPAQPLSRFVAQVLASTGLGPWRTDQDPRHENDFLMLRSLAAQFDDLPTPQALDQLLAQAALTQEADEYDAKADAVTLMTLHAAKGLEFNQVFLCGLEETLLPYRDADLEEERRLFYVGLTRAKECACLLHCRRRFLFGERTEQTASRFITEFDDALKQTTNLPDRPIKSKKPEEEQLSLL